MITNAERQMKINALKEQLKVISDEASIPGVRLYFLNEQLRNSYDSKLQEEAEELRKIVEQASKKRDALFSQLRTVQVEYIVKYSRVVVIGGVPTEEPVIERLWLSTYVDQESIYKKPEDLSEEVRQDRGALVSELVDFLYYCRSSKFEISDIRLAGAN